MHLHRVLLMTVVSVLASSSPLVATKETSVSLLDYTAVKGHDAINRGRALWAAKASDEIDNVAGEEHLPDVEERANSISTSIRETAETFALSVKTTVWLEQYKSVDYVQDKLENIKWKKGHRDVSTYTVWNELHLNQEVKLKPQSKTWDDISDDDILAELVKIKQKETFEDYREYAIAFSSYKSNLFGSGYYRPTYFRQERYTVGKDGENSDLGGNKNGFSVRTGILGLMNAKKEKLQKDRFFQFYLKELEKVPSSG
ncbi:hypothetical protein F444_11840 [Phytophthora nicotianae P1976]|uniref:RxLR effector protein n=1 Tax=Phytophthora nicotianae P1976 TaxID=1317066 RepID=A0A080ZZ35_PHYNI|nr:hypothetical protein F444_11840 [Phytophthora nicotianae P1976]